MWKRLAPVDPWSQQESLTSGYEMLIPEHEWEKFTSSLPYVSQATNPKEGKNIFFRRESECCLGREMEEGQSKKWPVPTKAL